MKEIWKDIEGYEGKYQISNKGRVKSLGRVIYRKDSNKVARFTKDKIRKLKTDKCGYKFINLSKNGISKNFLIHRLVAEAYIPNPDNLPEVDHIDNDKTHNYLNNLQWLTNRDNNRKSKNKPILQYSLDGEFIREWDCASDVGKRERGGIKQCLRGKSKSAYGYIWKYKN